MSEPTGDVIVDGPFPKNANELQGEWNDARFIHYGPIRGYKFYNLHNLLYKNSIISTAR